MKICIICREEKSNFNDEHVIPDSIQGYYHIDSVCTDCNSKIGSAIDNKLTNHKFIELQRHLLGIKGKSGNIPNPFVGTHVLKENPDQKVRLEVDNNGKFIPRLLPNVPTAITNQFTITLDKKDEDKKETKGGIRLPDNIEIPTITGRIVAVSAEITSDPMLPLKQYDKVLFNPKNAIPVDFEGDNRLFVIDIENVVAVFRRQT